MSNHQVAKSVSLQTLVLFENVITGVALVAAATRGNVIAGIGTWTLGTAILAATVVWTVGRTTIWGAQWERQELIWPTRLLSASAVIILATILAAALRQAELGLALLAASTASALLAFGATLRSAWRHRRCT